MSEMLPKYYILKKNIIDMIDSEEYRENDLIPSERDLIAKYGVSRITVRKAIDDLVNEGYLYRVQGKGTYVKGDKFEQDLFQLTSCTEEINKMGMVPTKKIIDSKIIFADKLRQRRLQLDEGDKVFYLKRVYYADGEPLNLTTAYLPYKLFPGIEKYDFNKESIYKVLEENYEVKIAKATRTLEAVIAHEEVSEYLNMQENTPILLFRGITHGTVCGMDKPIESFKSYYRSDKFKFFINQVK